MPSRAAARETFHVDRLECLEHPAPLGLGLGLDGLASRLRPAGRRSGPNPWRGERERPRRHRGGVRQERHPLDHVRQLADVARPGVRVKRGPGVRAQCLRGQAVVLAGAAQEVLGQPEDVLASLAQRRKLQRHHGQPMIEILPEAVRPDRLVQVLARGGDQPDVDRLAPGAAEPADGLLLEHLEELRLQAFREEAHLVEEEGAAMRCLEEARLGLARVGECAPLEAEQFRLQQGPGNRGAVDVNERPRRAGPPAVDGPGQEPLPGASFAEDENRRPTACALGLPL